MDQLRPHLHFLSRRSPVYSCHGMVAASQPLAVQAGIQILRAGGNAADAAVAVTAALNVTEPCSTGIGGDCFCLFWDAKAKKVKSMNASGRSPKALNLEFLATKGITADSPWSPINSLCVTVPGAPAGWVDCVSNFGSGKISLSEILAPAIQLAEEGFPVGEVAANSWKRSGELLEQHPQELSHENLLKSQPNGTEMLLNQSRAPRAGEIMKNPNLAQTFRKLGEQGKDGFYKGTIAEAIVDVLGQSGGVMSLEDLQEHKTIIEDSISTTYRGYEVHEVAPNGQGIQALMALNILEGFDLTKHKYGSPEHLHLLLESMRLAFSDGRHYIADPEHAAVPIKALLSKTYAQERRSMILPEKANPEITKGYPEQDSDTVYFCVVDGEGNACSFINSNYMGFGTGIVPKGCGFTLQNRGHNFNLEPTHANVVAPQKRPYHTIIPGMITKDENLVAPFGVMGGFMQPQAHLQVVSNLVDWKMTPQQALDAPRFCIYDGTHDGEILYEDGFSSQTITKLKEMGHKFASVASPTFQNLPGHFGTGQIILRNAESGVLCAGSDGRNDSQAVGY